VTREVQAGGDPVGGHEIRVSISPYLTANGAVEEPYLHDIGVSLGGYRKVHVAGETHLFAG